MNGTLKLQRKRRWTALNDCKENDVEGHLMTAKRTVVNAVGDCKENGVERHFITAKNKGFKRYLLIAKRMPLDSIKWLEKEAPFQDGLDNCKEATLKGTC